MLNYYGFLFSMIYKRPPSSMPAHVRVHTANAYRPAAYSAQDYANSGGQGSTFYRPDSHYSRAVYRKALLDRRQWLQDEIRHCTEQELDPGSLPSQLEYVLKQLQIVW